MNKNATTIANRLKPLVLNVGRSIMPAFKKALEQVNVPFKCGLALGDAFLVCEGNLALKFSDSDES